MGDSYTSGDNSIINVGGNTSDFVGGRDNTKNSGGSIVQSLGPIYEQMQTLSTVVGAAPGDHQADQEALEQADAAAKEGDEKRFWASLKRLSKWALTLAQQLGLNIIANELTNPHH